MSDFERIFPRFFPFGFSLFVNAQILGFLVRAFRIASFSGQMFCVTETTWPNPLGVIIPGPES